MTTLCLVTARVPPERCGIGDYTACLASALASTHDVVIVTGTQPAADVDPAVRVLSVIPGWGWRGVTRLCGSIQTLRPDWVFIEYVPFLYHRVGMSLWLPLAVVWLRVRGMKVLLTVHEPFVEIDSAKHFVMGAVQRLMLSLLIAGSEAVSVTTDRWTTRLKRSLFLRRTRIFNLGVGSNIPCINMTSLDRARVRHELGFGDGDVIVAMMNPTGAGKQPETAMDVWRRLSANHPEAALLILGATAGGTGSPTPRVVAAGYVSAARASRLLAAADIFFAPFVDGMSARRTSVMAAMSHGLPVVTTAGHLTDPVFVNSPLLMRGPDDADGLLSCLEELVASDGRRRCVGADTRAFCDRHFSWPVIVKQLNAELET